VKFREITRWGRIEQVLDGIDAALDAGLKVKINAVALRGINEDEVETLMCWAHGKGMDFTLIETMPMGEIDADRTSQYLPLSLVRRCWRSGSRWRRATIAPAGRPGTRALRRRAGGSGSLRRSRIISARAAIGCG
jgi:molybdenum cofactor biosynthesis enzyme MoaA